MREVRERLQALQDLVDELANSYSTNRFLLHTAFG